MRRIGLAVVLTTSLLAVPLEAEAQVTGQLRIGLLHDSSGALRGGVRSGPAGLSPRRGPPMWLLHLLLTLTIAGLLTSIPCPGYEIGRAHV